MPFSALLNPAVVDDAPAPPAAVSADAYVSIASQYVYRGVASRNSGPVVIGALALAQRDGWFLDTWAGQTDIQNHYDHSIAREWQLDFNAGYAAAFTTNWQWSLSRAWIKGFNNDRLEAQNYQEWRANLFYRDNVAMQFAYSENYRQLGWSAWNVEIERQLALSPTLDGELGYGRSHGAGKWDSNYNYFWVGVKTQQWHTDWHLRWTYSDDDAKYVLNSNRSGNHIELSASWALTLAR
ncbi:MAG: hypothetical protein JWM78_981 [Verrucomicrobiaceae bacterium]|nr:hypothetical protein [Verrucomicrobiaceae bacterium]